MSSLHSASRAIKIAHSMLEFLYVEPPLSQPGHKETPSPPDLGGEGAEAGKVGELGPVGKVEEEVGQVGAELGQAVQHLQVVDRHLDNK